MFDMLLWHFAKYNYAAEITKSKLPFYATQDHIHGALKCERQVAEWKKHVYKSVKAVMRGKVCFVFVNILHFDLPLSATSFQLRK